MSRLGEKEKKRSERGWRRRAAGPSSECGQEFRRSYVSFQAPVGAAFPHIYRSGRIQSSPDPPGGPLHIRTGIMYTNKIELIGNKESNGPNRMFHGMSSHSLVGYPGCPIRRSLPGSRSRL